MKILLLILFPFLLTASNPPVKDWLSKNNDAAHFYGAVAIGELSHGIQVLSFKEQTFAQRLLIDWMVCQIAIFSKEVFDCYKANPTGFSGNDISRGEYGTHARIIVKISLADIRKYGLVKWKDVKVNPHKDGDKYNFQ